MTQSLVPRGSAGSPSSSNPNETSTSAPGASSASSTSQDQQADIPHVTSAVEGDNLVEEGKEQIVVDELSEHHGDLGCKGNIKLYPESLNDDHHGGEKIEEDEKMLNDDGNSVKVSGRLTVIEGETDSMVGSSRPPSPPKPSSVNSDSRRSESPNAVPIGLSRRAACRRLLSSSSAPAGSRPSFPQLHRQGEAYNIADEKRPFFSSSSDNADRERQFKLDLKRVKGLEVRKMLGDGNCLFRAVADQVYDDSGLYDLVRQMCVDYMEKERDHFSEFITQDFTAYCERKRENKVFGDNTEIQAISDMYNRPVHIYSYSTEPINTFHSSYNTELPPIQLSYLNGNHYDSLIDRHPPTISILQEENIDKDQVKEAVEAQQDQQIENALLAEGHLYSDREDTEKEIEDMVMQASLEDYFADQKLKQQNGSGGTSTAVPEPSSTASRSDSKEDGERGFNLAGRVTNTSILKVLALGFSYMRVIEAYTIFGDDVDSMVFYLTEISSGDDGGRGEATQQ